MSSAIGSAESRRQHKIMVMVKAFLGRGNAYNMAMEPSSVKHLREDMEVSLVELRKEGC
jgi:hypothetical protein